MKPTVKRTLTLLSSVIGLHLPLSALATEPPAQEYVTAVVPAIRPEGKEQLGQRLASISVLIETSSAAKKIESSAVPEAHAKRNKARALLQQAEQDFRSKNYPDAARLLDLASQIMLEGARLVAPEQGTQEKKRRDFDNRMESVKALLAAQKRIAIEKNSGAQGKEISNEIEAQMREATALVAAHQLDQGRALLDQAYNTTKKAIESMRSGATLVRSLVFSSKEEEYRYEIDRNDTHHMLIKVLLDETRANHPELEEMVTKYLKDAASLRKTAEGSAVRENYVMGISLLEDSTKALVRAIRGAGVYIPE